MALTTPVATGSRNARMTSYYALMHGLGEFCVAAILFSNLNHWNQAAWLLLAYNACAFAAAPLVGLLFDTWLPPGKLAAVGCLTMAVGCWLTPLPWVCVIVLGMGNACLHVAAGMGTLRLPERGASAVGVFLGPGAVGLAAGTLFGNATPLGAEHLWIFCAIFLAGAVAGWLWGNPVSVDSAKPLSLATAITRANTGWLVVIAALLIVQILRSMLFSTTPTAWKVGPELTMAAAVAIGLGRSLGGVLADWLGIWKASLITWGLALLTLPWSDIPALDLLGLFAIAMSIAQVFAFLARMLPGFEGTVLGLGQFCQFFILLVNGKWSPIWLAASVIACAALTLWAIRPQKLSIPKC